MPATRPLARGERLVQADLADTLAAIAESGPDAFYTGPIAERIAAAVRAAGGVMTAEDLAAYRPVLREPVRGTYRGYEVVSMPPPSSGGIHLIEILNVLEGFDLARMGAGSADALHHPGRGDEAGLCRPRHLARRPGPRAGAGARA